MRFLRENSNIALYQEILNLFDNQISFGYFGGAAYILKDGEYLNIEEGSHMWVDDFLYDNNLIETSPFELDKLILIDDFNCIRVNDGVLTDSDPYIELPTKLPTYSQLDTLENWLTKYPIIW